MIDNLLLLKKGLENDIHFTELTREELVKTLIELSDLELICLYIKCTSNYTLSELKSLIDCVKLNVTKENAKYLKYLIDILNNKPTFIKYEFSQDIMELQKMYERYLTWNSPKKIS